jgi:hypothetical protein
MIKRVYQVQTKGGREGEGGGEKKYAALACLLAGGELDVYCAYLGRPVERDGAAAFLIQALTPRLITWQLAKCCCKTTRQLINNQSW